MTEDQIRMLSKLLSRVKDLWSWCDRIPNREQLETDLGQRIPLGCVGTDVEEAQAMLDTAKA